MFPLILTVAPAVFEIPITVALAPEEDRVLMVLVEISPFVLLLLIIAVTEPIDVKFLIVLFEKEGTEVEFKIPLTTPPVGEVL